MPNFSLSHKRVKVLARMRIRAPQPGKSRPARLCSSSVPRSGPRTAGFHNEIRRGPEGERAECSRPGLAAAGLQELSIMKLFTGSLAAGLVLLAGGAQAQVPGRYTAASDFDAPYAVAPAVPGPRYVPGPHYAPGPQFGYAPGPGLLPSIEVYSVLRDNGFSPLGIPRLRGFVYTIAVIDRGGEDGRLVIDARNGRIIRFVPSYRMGDNFYEDQGALGSPSAGPVPRVQ